jgi:hypothetical protein
VTDDPSGQESAGSSYVDHPTPGVVVLGINVFAIAALGCAIVFATPRTPSAWFPLTVMGVSLLLIGFFFWPLYSTYYTLSAAGLVVRYGPWIRTYSYSDFVTARWNKGLFGERIGWYSITPSVRLTNAVVLQRRSRWKSGLYLTPKDPKAFLERLSHFAPELIQEAK